MAWWEESLSRFCDTRAVQPGGNLCWACGQEGSALESYCWFECTRHPEGLVKWYGGAKPLVPPADVPRVVNGRGPA